MTSDEQRRDAPPRDDDSIDTPVVSSDALHITPTHVALGSGCAFRVWDLSHNGPPPLPAARAAIVATAREVKRSACPPRRDARRVESDLPHAQAVALTHVALADPTVHFIYGAAASHRGVDVRITQLRRLNVGWCVVEVHASSRLKRAHVGRIALLRWVLSGAGVDVQRAEVHTLNPRYRLREEEGDRSFLFRRHDVSDSAVAPPTQAREDVDALLKTVRRQQAPVASAGRHCKKPRLCGYAASCVPFARHATNVMHPISELPNLTQQQRAHLAAQAISRIDQLPQQLSGSAQLSALQTRVRDAVQSGRAYLSPDLSQALSEVRYPIHHIDFETLMPALPRYPGTGPFEALPFQWSNHTERADGEVRHSAFLCDTDTDPRHRFAETLLESLGEVGSICVYTRYESQMITLLARVLPRLSARLLKLKTRVWDLHRIIKTHYYHPDFRGSFALKRTLPVLVPGRTYAGMVVSDGMAAAHAYAETLDTPCPKRRAELRNGLLSYCAQDTLAMVEMRRALAAEVRSRLSRVHPPGGGGD